MHNVFHEIRGDKLLITVDISQTTIAKAPMSKAGGSRLIGSRSSTFDETAGLRYVINIMAPK